MSLVKVANLICLSAKFTSLKQLKNLFVSWLNREAYLTNSRTSPSMNTAITIFHTLQLKIRLRMIYVWKLTAQRAKMHKQIVKI